MSNDDLRVLMVEDEPETAQAVKMLLNSLKPGWEIVWANCILPALKLLKDGQKFDVVLLDLGLPETKGPAAIAYVREADSCVPIVVVSGSIPEQEIMYRMGAQVYLQKPVVPELLLESIGQAIAMRTCTINREIADRTLSEANSAIIDLLDLTRKPVNTAK